MIGSEYNRSNNKITSVSNINHINQFRMKSIFSAAVLALVLSATAAPLGKHSSAHANLHSHSGSSNHTTNPSESSYGPPTFFGDNPSTYKGPPRGSPESQASSPTTHRTPPSAANATSPHPHLSTSTSSSSNTSLPLTPRNAPAQPSTPDYKSYVSHDSTTMFGLQNPTCSAVTLIFARGTTEKGNMGTCVGPSLASSLREKIPSLAVQGVDYPANSEGNTKYGASGGPNMAMLARAARKMCPGTKIVLAGYSQGARCIHGALGKSEEPFDGGDVAAVVAFGDPLNGHKGEEFEGVKREKVLQVCGDKDGRCQDGKVDLEVDGGHISYGSSAEDVAEWIQKTVG